jgi:hypothetical protein
MKMGSEVAVPWSRRSNLRFINNSKATHGESMGRFFCLKGSISHYVEDDMKHLPNQPDTYSTTDLGIAVFLFTSGHTLVKTSVIGQRRLVFHFKQQENTDELVANFLNGSGKAPAKQLFENYRALRGMAFSQTNNIK